MIALHCFYLLTQSEWLLSIRSCVFVRSHQSLSDKWFISVLRDTWLIIDRQATSYNFYFRVVFVSFRDRWALHKHEKKKEFWSLLDRFQFFWAILSGQGFCSRFIQQIYILGLYFRGFVIFAVQENPHLPHAGAAHQAKHKPSPHFKPHSFWLVASHKQ